MSQVAHVAEPVTFLFDIIVTRLHFFKDKIDKPQNLLVNIKFTGLPINITSSRINVTDFQAGRRTEIRRDPLSMRGYVESFPMPISVKYNGATLGTAKVTFPPEFTDRIDAGMSDLMHADTCSIIRKDQEVGTLEFLCFLTIKCEETAIGEGDEVDKFCQLGEAINKMDVMFLLGEPQPCEKPREPCMDQLDTEEGDERLRLDLGRYKSYPFNQRVSNHMEEICAADATCELKIISEQYGQIIDKVVRQMNQLQSPMRDDEVIFTDWSGKGEPFRPKHEDRTIPIPIGDFEKLGVKPLRYCPVCLTPMSWLPKYANCPTCCAKPKLEIKSEEKLTANQIINQILLLPAKKTEDFCSDPCKVNECEVAFDNADEKETEKRSIQDQAKQKRKVLDESGVPCRCTCTMGKLCVHCRIRNLCKDIFKPRIENNPPCPKVQPGPNEDFAIIVEDEAECRPYLERVFTDLRDLYDKRDAAHRELDKRCTQSSFRFDGKRSDKENSDNSSSNHALKAVGSPTLLHRVPQPKIGHKSCVKTHGVVSRRHGWSWKSSVQARKYGWRPGAICRYAGAIMKFFLQYTPDQNAFQTCGSVEEDEREKERLKPIVNICKRDGAVFITLRPGGTSNAQMQPIIFKIVKSDLAVGIRKLKQKLKALGFRKCTCHQTLMMCVCRKAMEKHQLVHALQKECRRLDMENCVDKLILTDTSESEMEYDIDVSPPAASVKPLLAIKPRTNNINTQTDPNDQVITPKLPIPLDPYWRSYDCAVGDRYTGTAFGGIGEQVFEDGVFGFRGVGLHGPYAAPGGKQKPKGIWGAQPGGSMRGGGRVKTGAKSFPGAKQDPTSIVKSRPIPVRMTDKYNKDVAADAKAKKDAIQHAIGERKKGINLVKYLEKKGAVPTPWNPNEPKPKVKTKTGPVLGRDGLTDAQRKRRALHQVSIPPLDALPHLGRGIDPCATVCYNPWSYQCSYPCYDYC